MKYGNRCRAGLTIRSIPLIHFFHLCLDYFQTEFEAAHGINKVKIAPQTTLIELRKKPSNKRQGKSKITSKNQTKKCFFN